MCNCKIVPVLTDAQSRSIIRSKADFEKKSDAVLDNIIDMIYNPTFQEKLKHSTPREIDQKVQAFLA